MQQAEKGERTVAEVYRQHNILENSFCRWRTRFGAMNTSEATRRCELEKENARLKRLLAQRDLAVDIIKKTLQTPPKPYKVAEATDPLAEERAVVAQATERGLSKRRPCRLVKVSRSSARYCLHPRDDRALQQQIKQKHPRFGTPRVHTLLRAEGQIVNHKRVERLRQKSGLQVPKRLKERKLRRGRRVPC